MLSQQLPGLAAGINAASPRLLNGEGKGSTCFSRKRLLLKSAPLHARVDSEHFQPMNVNFGIIKELEGPLIRDKKER